MVRKGTKTATEKTTNTVEQSKTVLAKAATTASNSKKRMGDNQNHAVVDPVAQPPIKKAYTGIHPQCNTCKYHHPANLPCRQCTRCGRFGHFVTTCRVTDWTQGNPQTAAQEPLQITNGRACYHCRDPNHMLPQCPKLNNVNLVAHGRAFNINSNEANDQDDDNPTG